MTLLPQLGHTVGCFEEKHELTLKYNERLISREEYEEELALIEKNIAFVNESSSPEKDESKDKLDGAVSKALRRALNELKVHNVALYLHLSQVFRKHEGRHCYVAVHGIDWQLFP